MSEHPPQFSVKKLWIILLVLTAAEVVYGEIGNRNFYEQKLLLWGGLLIFAYFKGYYIYQYFMHMKYEGAIVKGNVWFTVPLVIYFMIMLWPDTAANDKLNYEIAHQLDPMTGDIATMTGDIATIIEGSRNLVNEEFRYLYDDYAATHPGAEIHGEGGN